MGKPAFASRRRTALSGRAVLLAFVLIAARMWAQTSTQAAVQNADQTQEDKPIPILTGNFGTFSFVTGGQNLIDTQINPVLLLPLGERWLIESRAEFEGQFQRPAGGGPYQGPVTKHVD